MPYGAFLRFLAATNRFEAIFSRPKSKKSSLSLLLQKIFQYLTGPTDRHLLSDIDIFGTFTLGSTDKPAQITTLKFISRTLIFHLTRFSFPTWLYNLLAAFLLLIDKKPELTLNVQRNLSPPLLIAVNCFQRYP